MSGHRELMFAESCDASQVVAALSSRYTVVADPSSSSHWVCLDSAEWRLHNVGITLRERSDGRVHELVLNGPDGERLTGPSRAAPWPRRIEGVAAGPVRDRLSPVLGVRALLPRAEVNANSTPLRILDDEGKTRTRIRIDQQRLAGDRRLALPLRIVVSPLRGYERDAERCVQLLTEAMPLLDDDTGPVAVALRVAGQVPTDGAPRLDLDPDGPVIHSLAEILLRSAEAMNAVRTGVIDDIDPEFLHDLRTTLRATRSILSLAGELLPGGAGPRFAPEFAWLGQLTSPVRDLDVCLLELSGRGTVDLNGLTELTPLVRYLASRRRTAFRQLREALRSPREAGLRAQWQATLEPMRYAPGFLPTTGHTAVQLVQRAYRQVTKAAVPVHTGTPADDLHGLRRRAKRLRYLLDGFESVLDPEPRRLVVAELKKLQDCLGDIQDADVQRRFLTNAAEHLGKRGVAVGTLLDIGALRERMAYRDRDARREVDCRLQRVTSAATRAAVAALQTSGTEQPHREKQSEQTAS